MRTRTKVFLIITFFLYFLAFCMLYESPSVSFILFLIPIFIGIIKSIIKSIKKINYYSFLEKGKRNYEELMKSHNQWLNEFTEVDDKINKISSRIQPPYNSRLYEDVNLLVQAENKYRKLANDETDFCQQLRTISNFYGLDFYSNFKKVAEFDDIRVLKLYSNILAFLCEKVSNRESVSKEEMDFLVSFEKALKLNVFDEDDVYSYWKSFGKNRKKTLISNLLDQIISNGSISENQEAYLYKIFVILTYNDISIEKLFPEKIRIIGDFSLARTLVTKQLCQIDTEIPFPLNKDEICYYQIKNALFAKTRCEDEKYYPVGSTEECQVFVTNKRFIIWGLTSRAYGLSAIAGTGITDNKYFIYKLRDKVWPLCLIISQPYALQAIINRCVNL